MRAIALTFHGVLQLLKEALTSPGPRTFQIWVDGRASTHGTWFYTGAQSPE
jgi:hypothetical protein